MSNSGNDSFKKFLAVAALGGGLWFMYNMTSNGNSQTPSLFGPSYSDVFERARKGEVPKVVIQGKKISGYYTDGSRFTVDMPAGHADPVGDLIRAGVGVESKEEPQPNGLVTTLTNWFPMLLLIGVWIFFMKQMQNRGGGAMGFGKSKAKLMTEIKGRVTFEDVAGVDEAKEDLEEIVDFLKDPGKFQRLGGKIPKGALLTGPPGTGKTLLARATAGEAGVPFFTISGSEFVEMFVGVGASRVRDMFEQAKKNAPCIVFIDEIDAVGRQRGGAAGGGNDEREQTLNQLLVEMDGFEKTDSVIIIAATNRPDILDGALKRPGRFDRQIAVPLPDVLGREHIIKVHARHVPVAPDFNAKTIARGTPGFSGADLGNLVNEAALLAARRNKRLVTQQEFEDAREKIIMGPEKKSGYVSEPIRRLVAYHEAGHALLVMHQPGYSEPVHKVTIIGRGGAGGYMARLPNEDKPKTRNMMWADMVVTAGGRVAEELVFGEGDISIGALADIAMVTDTARAMVKRYGFSRKMGFVNYASGQREILGQVIGSDSELSEHTKQQVDGEVKALVDGSYDKAIELMLTHEDQLENIAQSLLIFESLTGEEVKLAAEGGVDAVQEAREKKSSLTAPGLSARYSPVPQISVPKKPDDSGPVNDNLG